jgi:chromosome segregation ATPase
MRHELDHLNGCVDDALQGQRAVDADHRAIRQAIDLKRAEVEEHQARREQKEGNLQAHRNDLAKRNRDLTEQQQHVTELQDKERAQAAALEATREESERVARELVSVSKQSQRHRQELVEVTNRNDALKKEISDLSHQLVLKNNEVSAVAKEYAKQAALADGLTKRNVTLTQQKTESEAHRDHLAGELDEMQLENASLSKQAESDQKQIDDLARERDILNKNYLKTVSATQRQQDWLAVKENQRRNLEHQLRGFERHAEKRRAVLQQLARDTHVYASDAAVASEECSTTLDKVRQREGEVAAKQKDVLECEAKVRQQQTLVETVLSERNLFARNYLVLHDEINEMKRKFRGMQALIENLKGEIKKKEEHLMDEETTVANLRKEQGDHEIRIDNAKKVTEKRERMINAYAEELFKLNEIIAEADAEKSRQKRDHLNVMNERDILGAQLVRRNDELAKLYESIRIQQAMLRRGEAQYADRLRDIQQLGYRVAQLRGEFETMRAFASRMPELKLLLNKATRELTHEQHRVRVLLDETDKPRNVHRLRALEGREPQTTQLFDAVREMQAELLRKTADVQEKERLIAEREKLYVELKSVVARQPGPEVAEQLSVYKESLGKKSGQLGAMKASLRQFQEQASLYEDRFNDLKAEMKALADSYNQTMRNREKEHTRQRKLAEMLGTAMAVASTPAEDEEEYVGYTAPPRPHTVDDSSAYMEPIDPATEPPLVSPDDAADDVPGGGGISAEGAPGEPAGAAPQ